MIIEPEHPSAYAPDTAGWLAVAAVPVERASEHLAAVRERLGRQRFDVLDVVLVVDEDDRYLGAADLRDVMSLGGDPALGTIVRADWPTAAPETDQEHAADAAGKAGVSCLPVITADRRIIGCIPGSVLLDVLAREHHEDLHRMAGVLRDVAGARHALEDRPWLRVRRRIPWLLAGFVLSTAATALMAGFERALQSNVAIAFFIPALVYLTDAIGTQTEAIAVRALSLEHRPLARLIASEMITGALIGAILGTLAFVGVWAVFGDLVIAAGVAISLFAAGVTASVLGLVLPWMLSRAGLDPAFGSGPIATIVQDVLTILIYFVTMAAFLA